MLMVRTLTTWGTFLPDPQQHIVFPHGMKISVGSLRLCATVELGTT